MTIACPNCKYEGKPKTKTPGSIFIELILWLFFILPGLIYSIWRLSNRHKICPRCNFQHVMQIDV